MLGRVKLDNTLPACDQGNFTQITALNRNRALVSVVRDMCTTTVPPAPHFTFHGLFNKCRMCCGVICCALITVADWLLVRDTSDLGNKYGQYVEVTVMQV